MTAFVPRWKAFGPVSAVTQNQYGSLDETARVRVSLEGSFVGARREVNFLTGSNITYTVTDDAGNERVDVEISSTGGSSGLTQQQTMTIQSFGAF